LVFTRRTPRPWYRNPWGWGALSAGLVSTAMATAFHLEARQAADAAREAVYADDARRFNREVDRHNLTAGILWGVGGASTAAGILVFVLDRRWDEHRVVPELGTPKTTVVPGPGGVLLERWF
ncbi:MAG: hypothetical protein FJ098_16310, partial [Deltaproteobacteria bacterium]|nr:hypothetical protein [Deltaproteobacteria bacterium]